MRTAIYEFALDSDRFATLEVINEAHLDRIIDGFATAPMADTWSPPPVRITADTDAPLPDFVRLFGPLPVVSQRVLAAFGDALATCGEFLPLQCDDGGYWAFNVLATIDLLDEERSVGDWFGPGRLMSLKQLVARPSAGDLPPIFKLPQWRKGSPLLTQPFVDTARKYRLTGLDPRPVGQA